MSASMAEMLAEALYDRGNDVRQWPEDERDLYREVSCVSFMAAHMAVAKLRFEKAAAVLAANGYGKLEDAWEEGASAGLSCDSDRGETFSKDNPYKAVQES